MNKEILNIPDYILEFEKLDVWDRLKIYSHYYINHLYYVTINKSKEFNKIYKSFEEFNQSNYKIVDNGIDWKERCYAQRFNIVPTEIQRWYWLFKKEIFNYV